METQNPHYSCAQGIEGGGEVVLCRQTLQFVLSFEIYRFSGRLLEALSYALNFGKNFSVCVSFKNYKKQKSSYH